MNSWHYFADILVILVPVSTAYVFITNLLINRALNKQFEKINGTYKRASECALIHKPLDKDIAEIKQDIKKLNNYTHRRLHDLANKLQIKFAMLELEGEGDGNVSGTTPD